MRIRTYRRRVTAALAISLVPLLLAPWHAAADPARTVRITVHSEAMDRDIPLEVILPADTSAPRPTLYLLNGGRWRRGQRNVGRSDRCPGLLRRQERQRRDAAGRSVQLLHRLAEGRSRTRTQQVADVPHAGTAASHRCAVRYQRGQLHRGDLDDRDLGTQSRDLGTRALSECRGLQRVRGDFHPAWSGLRAPGGRCAGRR